MSKLLNQQLNKKRDEMADLISKFQTQAEEPYYYGLTIISDVHVLIREMNNLLFLYEQKISMLETEEISEDDSDAIDEDTQGFFVPQKQGKHVTPEDLDDDDDREESEPKQKSKKKHNKKSEPEEDYQEEEQGDEPEIPTVYTINSDSDAARVMTKKKDKVLKELSIEQWQLFLLNKINETDTEYRHRFLKQPYVAKLFRDSNYVLPQWDNLKFFLITAIQKGG